MCGIAGIFNFTSRKPVDRKQIEKMRDMMVHRGPDGSGLYLDDDNYLGLAHRRLSIIDISGGAQPMGNGDKSVWLVFNGEIYNFPELKSELQGRGHKFVTNSDTEVIIHFYEEYGEMNFHRLNGIFSIALYDKNKRQLILARDRFGVKPMYYLIWEKGLLFGSEIKAILCDKSVRRGLDLEALNTFLTLRYNPSPQTLFAGIRKLQPGYFLKVRLDGRTELGPYWDYVPVHDKGIEEQDAIQTYQRLLETAVSRQMLSDVPIGLMLSGGVDSAVIGRIMQDHSKDKIATFTVGFPGRGNFNELQDARLSASFIGSDHSEIEISQEDYLDFFYKSFIYSEEPIAEDTIPALYYVSKLAASKVKVVLAGQGADEPLAGYKRYYGERNLAKYGRLLSVLPLNAVARAIPRNERFKRAVYSLGANDELQRFLAIMTIFTPNQKDKLLQPDVRKKMRDVDVELFEKVHDNASSLTDSLSRLLYVDTRMLLSDDLLLFGDKMTMANSLEMRVPFLDTELVKFLESLPSEMKLRGTTHKYIHKKAVRKWLPNEIIYRKKREFETPIDTWLQNDLAISARNLLTRSDSACKEYFNLDFVNYMIDQHFRRKQNFRKHLFALLSFEVWYSTFYQNGSLQSFTNR